MKKLLIGFVLLVVLALALRGADQTNEVVVVNRLSYLSQSTNISLTTVASPTGDTNYVIQCHGNIIWTGSNDSFAQASVTYTNELNQSVTLGCGSTTGSPSLDGLDGIRAKSGTNVQISVAYTPNSTNNPYNEFFTVVQY